MLNDIKLQVKRTEVGNVDQIRLLVKPISKSVVRLVTHGGLSKYDIQMAIKKLNTVIEEYNMLQINFDQSGNVIPEAME